ncbi:MarR family winged helix-turn-helix transcriptional regulator [Flavihumibacter petaseus]|uniref:Putative MarR family transcriptional regulator n=1 Tax=Flavihumibacter petaseus NBRC 106054 TaxID=1220578 RepID=A0A0E9MYX5_9BACT|nr:MarR family transcriptional regulator [Flavihumibacter petaseus]GAO42809.1 putative MarR family transcriptional regulator [Flavihumibacter petaseus NBRC 106054]
MSLNTDINQPKFRNEHQKAMINLIYSYNWLMENTRRYLDQYDLTNQQFNILRILRGAGEPLSTLQIRQRMLDKMSDTSRIVDRLVKKELVQKVVCPSDRRLVDVTISDKGRELLTILDEHESEWEQLLLHIDETEASQLNGLLDKLRNSLD